MSVTGYTDRFIANLIVSGLVTCWTMFAVAWFDPSVPGMKQSSPAIQFGLSALLAASLLFVVPLLWGRVVGVRRTLFHDTAADLGAALRGRAIGLVLGLFAGVTLAMQYR